MDLYNKVTVTFIVILSPSDQDILHRTTDDFLGCIFSNILEIDYDINTY